MLGISDRFRPIPEQRGIYGINRGGAAGPATLAGASLSSGR